MHEVHVANDDGPSTVGRSERRPREHLVKHKSDVVDSPVGDAVVVDAQDDPGRSVVADVDD